MTTLWHVAISYQSVLSDGFDFIIILLRTYGSTPFEWLGQKLYCILDMKQMTCTILLFLIMIFIWFWLYIRIFEMARLVFNVMLLFIVYWMDCYGKITLTIFSKNYIKRPSEIDEFAHSFLFESRLYYLSSFYKI